MSARQNKKRKGRPNNRERTVTTFTQDPNTSFLVPLPSEDPPFAMYQHPFFQPALPPGNNDLEILENLKSIIKDGQHEFYRAVPQPAALASLYLGHIPPYPHFNLEPPPNTDTPPQNSAADVPDQNMPSTQPDQEDTTALPIDTKTDAPGEYPPVDTAQPDKDATKVEEQPQPAPDTPWERRPPDDDTDDKPVPNDKNGPLDVQDDRRFSRDRDRDYWDRDRHDPIRDRRDRDRRPEFFGRSYGRSHAPRPPPELRHYEPSYGDDYVPPPRRYDPDDRRGSLRNPSFDDRSKLPPFDDRRPPYNDRRPPAEDDHRLALDDRSMRRLPPSDPRPLAPTEDRTRAISDATPHSRTTVEDDCNVRASSLTADDRPRASVPLEERLSQPAPPPSLQDRLSQPVSAPRDIASAPSLEERLSSAPVPPRNYVRAPSIARDDLRAPPPNKDDLRDHGRLGDFKTNRAFSRERGGPPLTASTYRPDVDRGFTNRDDRDRRDRDVVNIDAPPARYGDTFNRGPPPRRFSPPPAFDRDRERDRVRPYYPPPPRSPPPFRSEGVYDPEGDRRYPTDRERDAYEQRRRDWYAGDNDKREPPPPPASWRPRDRSPFMDRDRERFDRERERDRDFRDRDRAQERERDLGHFAPPPPPTRAHWDDRDRRVGLPPSPPPLRMDTAGGVGTGRSLSARLTDPHFASGDDRAYLPPRDFDRGRYGGPPVDDHAHGPPFSRVRNRSLSPPRRGLADDLRPPLKRVREDNGVGYVGGGPAYSPPRRGGGDYPPGPPPSSTVTATSATTTGATAVSGTVAARSTGTRTPPAPPLLSSNTGGTGGGAFYERDQRDREREYVRAEYGVGYEREERGRRSPPPMGGRMGPGGGYGRGGVMGRDDRRYVPPPPRSN